MKINSFKAGMIKLEVNAIKVEKILNALWKNQINVTSIEKINIATIRFNILYSDLKTAVPIIKKFHGKYRMVWTDNLVTFLFWLKKRIIFVSGVILFFGVIYFLSNYIWAIEIKTENNLSPFEVRQELKSIGIKPGINKNKINVYNIEKKMEDIDDVIMWIRVRIQGSTLKVFVKEKVTPPEIDIERPFGVYAKMDGEIKRIYTFSGNPAVMPGDIVKKGDVLISSKEGREGFEKEVKPYGRVIANTFYTKETEVQVSGTIQEQTGNKSSDIFINICNKKIYLKKHIKPFESYDKIEERNGIINKIIYYEKKSKEINLNKDTEIQKCCQSMENNLKSNLSNDALIVDRKIETYEKEEGKLVIRAIFTVEQDIAENDW